MNELNFGEKKYLIASFGKRIFTILLDYLLAPLLVFLNILFLIEYCGDFFDDNLPGLALDIVIFFWPGFLVLLMSLIFYFKDGQTLGSKIMRIKLVDSHVNRKPSFFILLKHLIFLFLFLFFYFGFFVVTHITIESAYGFNIKYSILVISAFVSLFLLIKYWDFLKEKKGKRKILLVLREKRKNRFSIKKIMVVVLLVLCGALGLYWISQSGVVSGIAKEYSIEMNNLQDIDTADKETLETLSWRYSKDKNYLYANGTIVKNVDLKTFVLLHPAYGKDKNGIFAGSDFLEKVDSASFEAINNRYFRDKTGFYEYSYSGLKVVDWVDSETFVKIDEFYAKDKDNIFNIDNGNFDKISDVDVEKFDAFGGGLGGDDEKLFYLGNLQEDVEIDFDNIKIINNFYFTDGKYVFYKKYNVRRIEGSDLETFSIMKGIYAKDKDNIFVNGHVIDGVDVKTAELIDEEFAYVKDKNYVFIFGAIIKYADPETFEVLTGGLAKDKRFVYKDDRALHEVDVKTFELTTNNEGFITYNYAKDKNYVYFLDYRGHIQTVLWLDSKSFQVLDAVGTKIGDKNGIYLNDSGDDGYKYVVEKCFVDECIVDNEKYIEKEIINNNPLLETKKISKEKTKEWAKDGYCYIDGNIYFEDTDSKIYNIDIDNFEVLSSNYATDGKVLINENDIVPIENLENFRFLDNQKGGSRYFTDGQSVFYEALKISDDVANFRVINNKYSADSMQIFYNNRWANLLEDFLNYKSVKKINDDCLLINNKYRHCNGKLVKDVNTDGFEYLNNEYSKDEKYVYYHEYQDAKKVVGADAKTFKIEKGYGIDKNNIYDYGKVIVKNYKDKNIKISEKFSPLISKKGKTYYVRHGDFNEVDFDIDSFRVLEHNYYKDKNGIYYKGYFNDSFRKLDIPDIDSFKVLEWGYAKDKNKVYCEGGTLDESLVDSFQYLDHGYAKDKKHAYYDCKIVKEPLEKSYDGIPVSPNNFEYYCGDFAQAGNKYFSDGKFFTKIDLNDPYRRLKKVSNSFSLGKKYIYRYGVPFLVANRDGFKVHYDSDGDDFCVSDNKKTVVWNDSLRGNGYTIIEKVVKSGEECFFEIGKIAKMEEAERWSNLSEEERQKENEEREKLNEYSSPPTAEELKEMGL